MKKRMEFFLYNKTVVFIIMFIILLSHCYTEKFFIVDYSIKAITALLCAILMIFYLLNRNTSKICLFLILYCIIAFISSILGEHSSIILFFSTYCRALATAFYLDYGIRFYCKNTIRSFYLVFLILIFINFCTICFCGLYYHNNNYFFGYDNGHILMYIPAIMLMFIDKKIFNRKLNVLDWLLLLTITYSVFFCFSATSMIVYSIILLYLLFRKVIDKFSIFNSITYFITYLLSFIGFVILRIQHLFSIIIVDFLKKKLTFTHRTKIWDTTMNFIKENPIMGYGTEKRAFIAKKFGGKTFTSAHNTILDILYKYGVVGLVIFLVMLVISIKELFKNRKDELSKLLSIILFSLLVMMNFESVQSHIGFYIVLISCFNISYIIKYINENKEVS